MGELNLLHHIYRATSAMGGAGRVAIGPGDDMGAVRVGGALVLATVDQVADGVHVELKDTPLELVARKAITRNLSDIAAMAARPVGGVAAACLPRDFGDEQAQQLFDHMHRVAEHYDCPLFGGDISTWDGRLLLTVTLLAEPALPDGRVMRRDGAKVGNIVCVTGRLGGSFFSHDGYRHHLQFEPRLELARRLAGDHALGLTSMIDLSDGLGRDLGHIARASGVCARLDAERLPISDAARALSKQSNQPAWQHAIGDGEDYELCFTLPADAAGRLPAEIDGLPITAVGRVVERCEGAPVVSVRTPEGEIVSADRLGWEHGGDG